jgi:uncharacterized protein (TIGR03000 family)
MKDIVWRFAIPAALLAALAPAGAAARADEPAHITVLVPPDAEVFFDGQPTVQRGAERAFVTPPLPTNKTGRYDVLARWKDGGKTVERTRSIEVSGGASVRVDFLAPAAPPTGAGVATSVGPAAHLLRREGGPGGPWRFVGDKEAVPADDLLIALPGAEIEAKDGTARLKLEKYFNSPMPVLEPAVTLHGGADYDMDFTLERGMVEIANNKKQGSACVKIRARGEAWEAILKDPDSRLLVEFYSAWPRGAPFKKKPGPADVPLARMTFLVLKGDVDLKHAGTEVAMAAPPGLAIIEWDSVTGMDPGPQRLEELPAWVQPPKDEADKAFRKKIAEAAARFADEATKTQSLDAAIDKALASDNPFDRRLGVLALAASDQLPRLGKVLRESNQADVWENAVLAMRHWIGRGPGQDQKLYQGMIDAKTFTPAEAETAVQLLHDFGDDDLARPATYQYLITHLDSDQLFVRGLAYWHLSRLAPEGKKFGYDPRAPKEQRDAAIAKWKELIPPDKVPPPPKEEGK